MLVTLTHYEPIEENRELEITVSYDTEDRTFNAILHMVMVAKCVIGGPDLYRFDIVKLSSISEFDVAFEKICSRVDWAELYAETINQ